MKPAGKTIWFPAKRYGWGWGSPNCWQGWLILLTWVVSLVTGALFLAPKHPKLFLGYTGILVTILIVICFIKGEKPRWRWGKD